MLQRRLKDLKRKKWTIEGDRGELAKDPPTIKSILSFELKYSKCMNSESIPRANGLGPYL